MPMATPEEQRKYQREWLARRRREFFAGKSCVWCGSVENLELDHIDPATKDPRLKSGTGLWAWAEARRLAEIAKCQVLCYPCHVLKTHGPVQHGKLHTYQRYKCRCEPCRKVKMDDIRKHRAKKKNQT